MKFKDYKIAPEIKERLEALGWNRPTDIQFKAIKPILDGEDVLAIAQTGTGKTASFVIPTLELILQNKQSKYAKKTVHTLVMVPTRELAKQIEEVYKDVARHIKVKVAAIYGGVEQDQQIAQLNNGVDVVISTPGRMFDLIAQKHLDISGLKVLVLDEADHMLDLGFIKDIKDVMRHIPKKRQTLFFSATINKKIKELAYDLVRNAIRIQISPKNPVAKNIEHSVAFVEMDDKRFFLENLIKENEEQKLIVFVRTKVRAERVKKAMERVAIEAETIHGDVEQKDRFSILSKFKSGECKVLITTDVAARGIDIPGVGYVVNYDLPEEPENYVHRVGRTGRGKEKGWAIAFCSPQEKEYLEAIEEYTGNEIEVYEISKMEYKSIIDDSDDGSDDWQSLLNKANEEFGTKDKW
ncbi:ATP-dependent RNA helicase RhlE [Lishizhenia tianjinensis]|uniref:ATP-dependent RNA helicase RhlE n=1 Tax=Lishizhenia tianjinensis TaxID=477690 RepID=A0A1I6YMD2_9FLAO|nr:DEAD/DEAH box helicase [Lishizhenia tianjinensis]SFT51649.1 ATP-dependent RNA helicase RhlE [Lishizhenia tianjinensis]